MRLSDEELESIRVNTWLPDRPPGATVRVLLREIDAVKAELAELTGESSRALLNAARQLHDVTRERDEALSKARAPLDRYVRPEVVLEDDAQPPGQPSSGTTQKMEADVASERYPKLSEKIHSERNWLRCKADWVAHAVELERTIDAVKAERDRARCQRDENIRVCNRCDAELYAQPPQPADEPTTGDADE